MHGEETLEHKGVGGCQTSGVSDCPTLPALSLSPKTPSEKGPATKRLPLCHASDPAYRSTTTLLGW